MSLIYMSLIYAQISIENFSPVRIDRLRDGRRGGGSLLYINSPLAYENTRFFSDGSTCEDVICTIGNIKTIVASVYRPPDACASQTKILLSFLPDYLKSSEDESYKDIMLTGDFNFPSIDWET